MLATIIFAVCWRIFVSLSTRTFFQPDEYFQSLEVAHHAVFGYGYLTWEWKVDPPIRSFFYPAIYVPVYWILKTLRIDSDTLIINGPKVLHGALTALTDIGTLYLADVIYGGKYSFTAYVLSILSPFHFYCLSRTFSNSIETSLTSVALCFWPWTDITLRKKRIVISLCLAALSCILRPTSAVLWLYLFLELIWRHRKQPSIVQFLISTAFCIGLASCAILCITDRLYFGRWTFTPINFLYMNMSSVSIFYGSSPWHFYITIFLPLLCGTYIPFFALESSNIIKRGSMASKRLLGLIVWTLAIYSLLGHKEGRFVHPLSSAIYVITSKSLVDLSAKDNSSEQTKKYKYKRHFSSFLHIRRSYILLIILGLLPAIYLSYFHARPQIEVMTFLRSLKTDQQLKSLGFLMPCHSTPAHAHLHRPELAESGRMWSLGCEPPLRGENISVYKDQTDIFYESPLLYLIQRFPTDVNMSFPASPMAMSMPGQSLDYNWQHEWPSHLIFFCALLRDKEDGQGIQTLLQRLGYSRVWRGGNGLELDPRRRGGVEVWSVLS